LIYQISKKPVERLLGYTEKLFYDFTSIRPFFFLWNNVADNWNCPTVYGGSLPYLILAMCVETIYGMHGRVPL
jgi:hypothetical protein